MKKSVFLLLLLTVTSCSHHTATLHRVQLRQAERSRELVQAATLANYVAREKQHQTLSVLSTLPRTAEISNSITLASANLQAASVALDLSANLLNREQALVGLPIADQSDAVSDLLATNTHLRISAEARETTRLTEEKTWRAQRYDAEQHLLALGETAEKAKNRSIIGRFWGWFVATLGVGGLVTLCLLCPAVLPILGRLLGWIVSKIPQLAGAIGVVSTKAYDSVVRGIENAKTEWNQSKPQSSAQETLHSNLSKEMDRDHKSLVRSRKATL